MWFILKCVLCSLAHCTHMQSSKSGQSPGLDAASNACASGETEGEQCWASFHWWGQRVKFEPRSDMNESHFSSSTHCWRTHVFCHEKLRDGLKHALLVLILRWQLAASPLFLLQFTAGAVVEHWNILHIGIFHFFVGRSLRCICCLLSAGAPRGRCG